jgi:hypothetical protein
MTRTLTILGTVATLAVGSLASGANAQTYYGGAYGVRGGYHNYVPRGRYYGRGSDLPMGSHLNRGHNNLNRDFQLGGSY